MDNLGFREIISKFSLFFANSWRFSLLILLAIISLGTLAYTTFLQREGFPEVEVPVVVINVQNFTNDLEKNNKELTIPIEQALKEISIIESFQSTTTPVGSFIITNVSPEFSSDEALKIIKDEISEQVILPETSKIDYQTFRAGSIDGTHDLLFSITNDSKSIVEMQNDAQIVASELASLNEVREANVIEQITKEVDSSGNEFFYQSQFQRVGLKNSDGNIEFKNAVNIGVVKRNQNVGTIELSEAVRGKVNDLVEDGVLSGYEINYGGDFAEPLKLQISSLEQNALSGLIAVIIISFIFISWRSSLITGLFIPVVMASTFMALFVMGYSLNIISLFALILVLGLLVDDVIIVVEAIAKKREEGLERKEAIKEAIKDIGPADISGTITTILVFMPMLFISGILGDFIVLIPVTVIMTLIFSLLIALSLFPMLSSWVLPKGDVSQKKFGKVLNFSNRFINKLGVYVSKYTNWYLNSKIKTTVVAILGIVLVGVGMNFAGKLDFNIFPKAKDSDSIFVNITYLPGTDIEKAKSIATDVENIILNNLDQSNIEYLTYYLADDTQATLLIQLTPIGSRDETAIDIETKLNSKLREYSDVLVSAESSQAGPPSSEYQFFAQIYSNDSEVLQTASSELVEFLKSQNINGVTVTDTFVTGLDRLTKKDGRRFAEVKAKLSDTLDTAVVLELENKVLENFNEQKLQTLGLDENSIEFDKGQESENLESFNSAIFAFGFSLIMMYALLVLQFNSFSQPLLVMFAIPLTFAGLFPGLYFTNNPLSFFVMIGVIGLSGIVVNNTIMLVDFANQSRAKGQNIKLSITKAIQERFRPLVTTSFTTVVGLIPLALNDPFWEGLAFSIVFGLIASTTLVIFVFPSYYVMVERTRELRNKLFEKISNLVTN